MSEFEYIFWTTKDGDAAPRKIEQEDVLPVDPTLRLKEEHGRSNRNSVNYMDGAPNAIVDLEKNMEGKRLVMCLTLYSIIMIGSRVLSDEDDADDLTISTDSSYSSK
jgi:hypothetical protein